MADHIVSSYDAELQDLRRTISEMGGIAEKMLADAITALVRGDTALAQAVKWSILPDNPATRATPPG